MHYDAIFEMAVQNVLAKWADMARAVVEEGPRELAASLPNCNLDDGRGSLTNELLFWTEHA